MPPKKAAAPPPHAKSDAIKPGTTFRDNNKRTITVGKELAQGGFGRICDVTVDGVPNPLIGKFEPGGNGPLFVEQSVFTRVLRKESLDKFANDNKLNFLGLPYVVSNGMYNDIRYLVMPKYSHCLDKVIKKKKSLPVKEVKQVVHCVLNALEYLHRNEHAHADIKAGNLMMNSEAAFDQVYLIDFGLCMRADKAVDKDNKKRAHNGTPFFTSTDAHRGIGPSYRGDIEILGHNMIYWLSGKIPWEKHEGNIEQIFNAKKTLLADLNGGLSHAGINDNDKKLVAAIFEEASRLGVTELPNFTKLHDVLNRVSDGASRPRTTARKEKLREDNVSDTKEEPAKRSRGRKNDESSEEADNDVEVTIPRGRGRQKKTSESIFEDAIPPKSSRTVRSKKVVVESDDDVPEPIIPGLNKKNRPPIETPGPASPSKVIPGMKGRTGSKRKAESTLSAKPRSRSNRLFENEVSDIRGKNACRTVTPPPRHFPMDARSLPRPEKKPICRADVIEKSPELVQPIRHRSSRLRSISPDDYPPSKSARNCDSHATPTSSLETPQSRVRPFRSMLHSSNEAVGSPVSKSTVTRQSHARSANLDDLENTSPEYKVVRVERPTGCALIMKAVLVLIAVFAVSCLAEDANAKLKKCCSKIKNEDKECITRFCDFDSISQTNVLNYLSTCTERGKVVGKMWDCASSRVDHTECCKAKGVEGKCLEYCAAHDGVPTNYLSYLTCLENFNEIRDCFKDHIEKN